MSIFEDAKMESAFLKLGFYGGNGSGKTHTASKVMIGLHHHCQSKKPIYFLDSETGSDYVKVMFDRVKIKLKVAKTRAFSDLLAGVDEAEKGGFGLLIDSITHFWDELVESFKKEKNITRLSLPHWGIIKPIWREFSEKFVTSNLHIIVCGRSGDVWEDVEDEEGIKELKRTGTKMRVEKELGHEPSLLVEMEKARTSSAAGAGWTHRAWVVKDRFDVIDSQHFDDPTFESFLPHIELLNLGGEHKAIDTTRDSKGLFPDNNGYARQKKHEIMAERVENAMKEIFPGQSASEKKGRIALMKEVFGTNSWKEILTKSTEELELGYKQINNKINNNNEEEKPDVKSA